MSRTTPKSIAEAGSPLEAVLARAKSIGHRAVVIFDLDSTLFDNKPRQARILREFGQARGISALSGCKASHFSSGWDLRAAMRHCGLTAEEAERIYPEAKQFWLQRFFTSDYCAEDVAIAGAPQFVKAVAETGAIICYVSGRPEQMKQGTLDAMRKSGFLVPRRGVHLILKASPALHDDDFKREAHRKIAELGEVVAVFDNEPTHLNDYRRRFPEAMVVHLATDNSGRPVALLEGILSIPDFSSIFPG